MVTGSIAMNYYARPRMTRDIDVVVDLQPADADCVYELFSQDFYVDRESLVEAIAKRGMFNIIHNAWIIKVDFIVKKEGEYRRLEFQRRRHITIEGVPVTMVTPEDLILSKLDWARESHSQIQLEDIRNLMGSVDPIDTAYLEQWVKKMGLEELYREALS